MQRITTSLRIRIEYKANFFLNWYMQYALAINSGSAAAKKTITLMSDISDQCHDKIKV